MPYEIDLNKLTDFDLRMLRNEVNEAIEKFSDRDKIKCYKVFVSFTGSAVYVKRENAIANLKHLIEMDIVFNDNEIKLEEVYYTQADIEKYCVDYKKS